MFRRTPFRLLLIAAIVAISGVFAITPALQANAQPPCFPRYDWPIYIVQRGDTLSVIARRTGATLWDLISANCLVNPNRLLVGQQLRVPRLPGATPPPVTPPGTISRTIPITYQQFENGFMVYRADSGAIWTFLPDGVFNSYLSTTYGNWPQPPYVSSPPGRMMPVMGFGKVWGSVRVVRELLGWAVASETSFIMQFNGLPTNFTATMPNGRTVQVMAGAGSRLFWRFTAGGPLPTVTPYPTDPPTGFVGTSTMFENGIMVWHNANNAIYVFFNDGTWQMIPAAQYGGLPDYGYVDTPPPGLMFPTGGFARVWHNFHGIRWTIGWATGSEMGNTIVFDQAWLPSRPLVRIELPIGRIIVPQSPNTWRFSDGTLPPIKKPSFKPTPTPTAMINSVTVGATYRPFENGVMVWRGDLNLIYVLVNGGELMMFDMNNLLLNRLVQAALPEPVPWTRWVPIGGFGKIWSNFPDVRAKLGWSIAPNETPYLATFSWDASRTTMTIPDGRAVRLLPYMRWAFVDSDQTIIIVPPLIPPATISATLPQPTAVPTVTAIPATQTQAAYQPFERGFMIWRADTGEILVFGNNPASVTIFAQALYGGMPDNPVTEDALPGLGKPVSGFGKVWGNSFPVRDLLGWATAAEGPYTTTIEPQAGGVVQPFFKITLPSGQAVLVEGGVWRRP